MYFYVHRFLSISGTKRIAGFWGRTDENHLRLEGFFGTKRWMAARLGELGGKAKSAAKARASRANGRMGGRPKKVATAA